VWMVQPRRDLDFAKEPLVSYSPYGLGLHHLDGHTPAVLQVFRQVDGGHPATADFADRAVPVEYGEIGLRRFARIGFQGSSEEGL
jgi:hypothetical protein